MRHRSGRALAVAALLALSTSWAAGWAIAFHLATDDHHDGATSDYRSALGLEMALHGHLHDGGTPAHTHPVVGSVAASVPARQAQPAPVMIGTALGVAVTQAVGRRSPSQAVPNHDPPPRTSVFVLRI